MSEVDWADVKAVRVWLEARYPVTARHHGSPFFQYLKDELAKGNKIRGRERRLCGNELLRWIGETYGDNAFCYPAESMKTPYYPEYDDTATSPRRLRLNPNQRLFIPLPNESTMEQSLPQQPDHFVASKPHKRRAARKPASVKKHSVHNKSTTRSFRRKVLNCAKKSSAASRPEGHGRFGSGGSRDSGSWTSRLRSPRSHKRGETGKNLFSTEIENVC